MALIDMIVALLDMMDRCSSRVNKTGGQTLLLITLVGNMKMVTLELAH